MEVVASIPHQESLSSVDSRHDGFQKMPGNICAELPAGFFHSRNQTLVGHFPETDSTQAEFAVVATGATA